MIMNQSVNTSMLAAWPYVLMIEASGVAVNALPEYTCVGTESKGDFGIVHSTPRNTVVVFKGSDDEMDWLSNLNVRPNKRGFHAGFFSSAQRLTNSVFDAIDNLTQPITLVGHSRGGAIALVMSAIIVDACPWLVGKVRVITFGCPKVSTETCTLRTHIASETIEHITVINGVDVIPHLPPEFFWRKSDYKQYQNVKINIGSAPTVTSKLSLLLFYLLSRKRALRLIDDHSVNSYAKNIDVYNRGR